MYKLIYQEMNLLVKHFFCFFLPENVDVSMGKKIVGVEQFPNQAEFCNLWIVPRTKSR